MTKYFVNPFAVNGDREEVPDAADPNGFVSYDVGYGFDYERDPDPNVDPLTKDIERDKMNQLWFDVTENIKFLQDTGGVPEWSPDKVATNIGYPVDAKVMFNGVIYTSTAANNLSTPGSSTTWILGGQTDPTIQAIAGTTPGANTYIWFSATDVAQVASITSFGRNLLTSNNAADARFKLDITSSSETVTGLARASTQAEVNGGGVPGNMSYVRPLTLRSGMQTSLSSNASGYVAFPQWFSTGQIPQLRYARLTLPPNQGAHTGNVFPNACIMAVGCISGRTGTDSETWSPVITPSGRGASVQNSDNRDTVTITVFMMGY